MSGIVSDNLGRSSGLIKAPTVSSDFALLGTGSASDVSSFTIDDLFTTTYEIYEYSFRAIYGASNGQALRFRFNSSSGTALTSTTYREVTAGANFNSSDASADVKGGGWDIGYIKLANHSADADEQSTTTIRIYDPLSTSVPKHMTFICQGQETNNINIRVGGGHTTDQSAVTGISIVSSVGNITVPQCVVYGIKE